MRTPGLRGGSTVAHHVLADTGLADIDAGFEQFTVDTWRAPGPGTSCESALEPHQERSGARVVHVEPSKSRKGESPCGAMPGRFLVSR